MKCRMFVACFLLCLLPASAPAQDRTHDVTPEDYFTLSTITEIALSPDGKTVACAVGRWDKGDDVRKNDLWVVPTDGKGKPSRLTFDRTNARRLKWSGDGKGIYFLANHKRAGETKAPFDGSTQLWRIAPDGGEAKALTREAGGVADFDYARDADQLFLQRNTTTSDDDAFAKLRLKFSKLDYGNGKRRVSTLHKLDPATWRMEEVVADQRFIREFAVTRDGKRIAMVSAYDDSVVKSEGESRVDIWEAGKIVTPPTDVYRKNAASPYAWLESLAWSRDGKNFAFCAIFDAYPAQIIHGSSGADWKLTRLELPNAPDGVATHVLGYGSALRFRHDALHFMYEARGESGLVGVNQQGKSALVLGELTRVLQWDFNRKHGVFVGSHVDKFPILMTPFEPDFPARRLWDPNPHTKTWKLPSVKHITWKAPDGSEVGGVLELPYGYNPKAADKPLPLVVAIHGGPTTSSKAELTFDPHNGRLYFAAKGYAVLCPNYRGSTGYGDKFVTDLIGHENDIEVKDILAGIKHLVDEGIADPNRVAVTGWSNGGYLTNCLITLKDSPVKFKAAASGAGILDTVAEWGFNDEPAYPIVFKKGLPWQTPDVYKKTSPTYNLGNVTTPTLIHVGGGDERCPPGHSKMLYRALKEYVKVPTELVVYPGEPHGLTKMSHRRAKMEWDLAWFEKYVKGGK